MSWAAWAVGAWAVGALSLEPVAAVGMVGTVAAALPAFARAGRAGWISLWPMAAFAAWGLAAPALAGHPPSGAGVSRVAEWLAAPFAAVAWAQLGARGRRGVLVAVAGTFLLSCALAGLQHFGAWPSAETLAPLGSLKIPIDRVYEPVPGGEGRFMAGGLAFHRLKFAHVGGLAALALLVAGLASRGRARALLLGAAAAGVIAIAVFPYARAALVALVCAGVAAGVLAHPDKRRALAAGAVLAAVAVLAVAAIRPLRERFLGAVTERGSGHRGLLLEAGASVVRAHPWTGIGPGRFRAMDHVPEDAPHSVRTHAGKAHNQFLSIAAETGVPGAILFAVMLAALARRMRVSSPEGAFGAAALVFFVLLSLLHDPLFHPTFSMAMVLAAGIGTARLPPR